VLVIGSGAAGLRAAIEAAKHKVDVILVSKSGIGSNNSTAVSAAVISSSLVHLETKDSPEVHYEDIVRKGRFICERNLARLLAYEIPQEILVLKELGVRFDMIGDKINAGWAPGHTYPRGCRCTTRMGLEITRPLKNEAFRLGVKFLPNTMITKLITDLIDEGVNGAIGINMKTGEPVLITSKAIVLATGGAGGIYKYTDNPASMTGDGYVLAYEAGAELIDMEFVQFHPGLIHPPLPKQDIAYHSLVVRGAAFRNALGEDIFKKYNLIDVRQMTRDVVSRIMMAEILEGRDVHGKIILEISDENQLNSFDGTFQKIIQFQKINVKEKLLLGVLPLAHSTLGGVKIDEKCQTTVEGLYAAGEVVGGVHGADRLAGNALAEAIVFGARAGRYAAKFSKSRKLGVINKGQLKEELTGVDLHHIRGEDQTLKTLKDAFLDIMWKNVGPVRSKEKLDKTIELINSFKRQIKELPSVKDGIQRYEVFEFTNMLRVSEMIAKSALFRTESRGTHFRIDFPNEKDEWTTHIAVQKSAPLRKIPVV